LPPNLAGENTLQRGSNQCQDVGTTRAD
jgi:hypothetical protein